MKIESRTKYYATEESVGMTLDGDLLKIYSHRQVLQISQEPLPPKSFRRKS